MAIGSFEEDVKLFQSLGLSEQKAKETLKNAQVTKHLKAAIEEVRFDLDTIFLYRRLLDIMIV